MNWNTRGINSENKWLALGNKIDECGCDIICLQETKRENFELGYIRKFCPKKFNKFEYLPSMGSLWGSNCDLEWCFAKRRTGLPK